MWWRYACIIGCLALGLKAQSPSSVPAHDAVPLMEPLPALAASTDEAWRLEAAQAALQQGFADLTIAFLAEVAETEEIVEPLNPQIRTLLARAYLAENQPAEALAQLGFLHDTSPELSLLRGLALFLQGDDALAEAAVEAVDADNLALADRAWWFLLRGLLAVRAEQGNANRLFNRALDLVETEALGVRFQLLRRSVELSRGSPGEGTLAELRNAERSLRGERAGVEAGRLLARALGQAGQNEEAVTLLTRLLGEPTAQEPRLRASLLLLLGELAGVEQAAGRAALREVLTVEASPDAQRRALAMLASAPRVSLDGQSTLEGFLGPLLDGPTRHPLREEMLGLRAVLAAERGDLEGAARDAERLLQEFPASARYNDALRLLAYLNWAQATPRWRTAADYLARLRSRLPPGEERGRVSALMADSFFQSGDWQPAAEAYRFAREDNYSGIGRVRYQEVLAYVRLEQFSAAETLLDQPDWPADWRWRAEWHLLRAWQTGGDWSAARARIERLWAALGATASLEALRLAWVRARFALDANDPTTAEMALNAFEDRLPQVEMAEAERVRLEAYRLLLRGQIALQAEEPLVARAAFDELRERFPDSDPAALSFLVVARDLAAQGDLAGAERSLIELADAQVSTGYAPVALWEAALMAEQRGTTETLVAANRILARLAASFPNHPLAFRALVKRGELARQLEDFAAAVTFYEQAEDAYPEHAERYLAEMGRAISLHALASDPSQAAQAVALFERLARNTRMPLDAQLEAAFHYGALEQRAGNAVEAQAAWWVGIAQGQDAVASLGVTGRYWLARLLLNLAEARAAQANLAGARELYQIWARLELPGAGWARAEVARLATANLSPQP